MTAEHLVAHELAHIHLHSSDEQKVDDQARRQDAVGPWLLPDLHDEILRFHIPYRQAMRVFSEGVSDPFAALL